MIKCQLRKLQQQLVEFLADCLLGERGGGGFSSLVTNFKLQNNTLFSFPFVDLSLCNATRYSTAEKKVMVSCMKIYCVSSNSNLLIV